jgi:hypothetical protein
MQGFLPHRKSPEWCKRVSQGSDCTILSTGQTERSDIFYDHDNFRKSSKAGIRTRTSLASSGIQIS